MRCEQLPNKAQINALNDVASLEDIKDDVLRSILHIEAQLESSSNDSEAWEKSAIGALAAHRFAHRQLVRRIVQLTTSEKREPAIRPEEACDPLTILMLRQRPDPRPERYQTVKELDAAVDWLVERLNAVTDDREDEIGLPAGERDEKFLAATGSLQRLMRGQRSALQTRRGELSREAKKAEQRALDAERERLFIDIARSTLDRDTFLGIWASVDRLMPRDSPDLKIVAGVDVA